MTKMNTPDSLKEYLPKHLLLKLERLSASESDKSDIRSTMSSFSEMEQSDEGQEEKQHIEEGPSPKVSVRRLKRISTVYKEGFLLKRDEFGLIKGWKRFYFCIVDEGISFYQDEKGKASDMVLGHIAFHKTSVGLSKKPNTFKIQNGDQKWHLRAESSEQRDTWIEVCKENMKKRASTDKMGYLQVVNSIGKKSPHFFVLKDGHLTQYRSEDELNKPSAMNLANATVALKDKTTFSIQLKNKRKITLIASTEVEAQDWIFRLEKEIAAFKHMRISSLFSTLSCINL